MNKDIKLGMKIQELRKEYKFKSIVKFLKGEETQCCYFDDLKPLYDEFGYKEVNEIILEVAVDEVNKDE